MTSRIQVIQAEFRCGHQSTIQARVASLQEVAKVKEALSTRLCYDCQLAHAQAGGGPLPRRRDERSSAARWGQRDRPRRY
jgi:hypothetical protein